MKRRRKLFSILLSLALVAGMIPAFTVPAQADDETIAHIGNTVVYRSDLDKNGMAYGDGWELQTDNTLHPGGYYKSQYFILRLNNYSGGPIIITGQDLLDITIVADGDNYIRGSGLDDGIIASPMNSGYCSMDFYVKAGSSINIDNVFNGIRIVHPTANIHLYGQDCETSQINIDSRGYGIHIHKGWDTSVAEDVEDRGVLTFNNIFLDAYASNQCLSVYQIQVANNGCASILLSGKTSNSFYFDPELMRMTVGDFGSTHLEIRPIEYHPYQPETRTVTIENGTADPSEATAGQTVTIKYKAQNVFSGANSVFDHWEVISGNVTLADPTSKTTTFTMPDKDVIIKAVTISRYHAVTVEGGTADVSEAVPYAEVTVTASTPPAGKTFDHWTVVSGGVTLKDETSATTSFVMGSEDVSIRAVWKDDTSALTNPFVDVHKTDEYYDAVLWAYYHDPFITNGIDATHFGPMNTVKRCESVTFLWRAMGCPEPSSYTNPFKDVKSTDYFYKPVLWAVEKGITNGTTATTFAPNDTLTTAHMITFLYRTKNPGKDGWYNVAANWAGTGYGGKPFGVNTAVNNTTDCPRAYVVMFLQKAK